MPRGKKGSAGKKPTENTPIAIRVREYLEFIEKNRRIAAMRKKQYEDKEECMLAVANALLKLRFNCAMTWEEIAEEVPGIADKGHAFHLAHRTKNLTATTYDLVCAGMTKKFLRMGVPCPVFPEYPQGIK